MINNRPSRNWPLWIMYFLITCFFAGALLVTIWFSTISYLSLVHFITSTLRRPDLEPLILSSLFTNEKYSDIYKVHWLLYPVIAAVAFVSYLYAHLILENVRLIASYLKTSFLHVIVSFKSLRKKEKIVLSVVCCLYCILVLYNDHLKQITYDEAWGYNYYVNKPVYFPVILFNTYPLFNLISHFSILLPFDTLINLRLPSLFFGLASLLILFYTLQKGFGFFLSVTALVLLVASPLVYIYSSLSRGITLSLFLAIVVFHIATHTTTNNTFDSRYRFLYILSNVLGIISMPTFLIYTIGNTLFLLACNKNNRLALRGILTSIVIVFVAVLTFYLPVMLNTGPSLIYHNDHYTFNIIDTVNKTSSFVLGLSTLFFVSKYVALPLLLISLILIFQKHLRAYRKTAITYSVFIIIFTILFRVGTGNIFPERSLNYLILSFILTVITLLSILLKDLSRGLKSVFSLLLLLVVSSAFIQNHNQLLSPGEDEEAEIIAGIFLRGQVKTVYIDEDEFWLRVPMIEYYYSTEHKQINFGTSQKNSTRYRPFRSQDNYNCVVSSISSDLNNSAPGYKIIYRTRSFIIWRKF